MMRFLIILFSTFVTLAVSGQHFPEWAIGPFERYKGNPVMTAQGDSGTWESQNVYNPAVIYRRGSFHMLYRGENSDKSLFSHYRSQIGYATSKDGFSWKRFEGNPVLRAVDKYELPGGLEDPRLVEYKGLYYCYYTAYSPGYKGVRLCVATSKDLKTWTKHGEIYDGAMKNGAILMSPENRPIKVNGKFMMYTSVQTMYVGYSEDLIKWEFKPMNVPFPESYYPMEFCVALGNYEKSKENILLFIGGRLNGNIGKNGVKWHYALGQCLIKKNNPEKIVELMEEPFMIPTEPYEQKGFVNYTLFFETLTRHKGEWWMFYGAADHQLALAKAKVKR
jgi:predicted GH43/DUF377 family glycosyl hydrolase